MLGEIRCHSVQHCLTTNLKASSFFKMGEEWERRGMGSDIHSTTLNFKLETMSSHHPHGQTLGGSSLYVSSLLQAGGNMQPPHSSSYTSERVGNMQLASPQLYTTMDRQSAYSYLEDLEGKIYAFFPFSGL